MKIFQCVTRIERNVLIARFKRSAKGEQPFRLEKRLTSKNSHSITWLTFQIENSIDDLVDGHLSTARHRPRLNRNTSFTEFLASGKLHNASSTWPFDH